MKLLKALRSSGVGLLLCATAALAMVPVLLTAQKGPYQGVPPAYVDDDVYYYARMKEVADGRPFIGNPYFIEHRDNESLTFSITDWIASIPLLLGVSFTYGIVGNFVVWSLLFVYLAYLVAKNIGMSRAGASMVAFLAYVEVYWLIMRPVIMQHVFPFFLLFILALFTWIRNPLKRSSVIALAAAGAASFYVYGYLWQIEAAVLGIVFLQVLISKKWPEVKSLLLVALGTVVMALPALLYALKQMSTSVYWETFARVGLLKSFLPTLDAYRYGRWAVLLVVLVFVTNYWLRRIDQPEQNEAATNTVMIFLGLGLLVASVSNVFTGTDVATGQHVGRFITLYVALFLPLIWVRILERRSEVMGLPWYKILVVALLLLAGTGFLVSNLRRALPFQRIVVTEASRLQEYAKPLAWLEAREHEPVVLWTNDDMSTYIPILTKHYVFWNHWGALHIMSTQEAEERFLASRIRILTTDELFASIEQIHGSGVGRRYQDAHDKQSIRCMIGGRCAGEMSIREWLGEAPLNALLRQQAELRKHMLSVLKKYHVSYAISDNAREGEDVFFKSIRGIKRVWSDERFSIYEIN